MEGASLREMGLDRVKSILVVRLDGIGDMVLTTPLLRELKKNFPHAHISLLVTPLTYNLVELCPYVDRVFVYNPKRLDILGYLKMVKLAFGSLREQKFDLALLPRWDVDLYKANLLVFLSGARIRVGYSERVNPYKAVKNKGYDSFLTHVIHDRELRHEVERNLYILRFLGLDVLDESLELWIGKEDETFAQDLLRSLRWEKKTLVAVAPGAGHPRKVWPASRFLEVCKWILNNYDARILVLGGGKERELGLLLEEGIGEGAVNLVSKTTLRQAVALLKRCKLFLGNDSSLMHMASACRVPVVALFCHPEDGNPSAPNSPLRFGPWKTISVVLQPKRSIPPCSSECRATYPHCILGIEVDRVKEAISLLLNGIIVKDEENN